MIQTNPGWGRSIRSVVIFAALLCVATAWAQTSSSGTVSGQVTDQQGATLPVWTSRLSIRQPTSETKTTTNQVGRYMFINVEPGKYRVTFSKTGFSTRRIAQQDVQVGQVMTVDAVLEIGAVSTVVEVTRRPAPNYRR